MYISLTIIKLYPNTNQLGSCVPLFIIKQNHKHIYILNGWKYIFLWVLINIVGCITHHIWGGKLGFFGNICWLIISISMIVIFLLVSLDFICFWFILMHWFVRDFILVIKTCSMINFVRTRSNELPKGTTKYRTMIITEFWSKIIVSKKYYSMCSQLKEFSYLYVATTTWMIIHFLYFLFSIESNHI